MICVLFAQHIPPAQRRRIRRSILVEMAHLASYCLRPEATDCSISLLFTHNGTTAGLSPLRSELRTGCASDELPLMIRMPLRSRLGAAMSTPMKRQTFPGLSSCLASGIFATRTAAIRRPEKKAADCRQDNCGTVFVSRATSDIHIDRSRGPLTVMLSTSAKRLDLPNDCNEISAHTFAMWSSPPARCFGACCASFAQGECTCVDFFCDTR